MYNQEKWQDHPGRNPQHIPGGYARRKKVKIPVRRYEDKFPSVFEEVSAIVRPRNPSRWLPHQGGAAAGERPNPPATSSAVSRQSRRQTERRVEKMHRHQTILQARAERLRGLRLKRRGLK